MVRVAASHVANIVVTQRSDGSFNFYSRKAEHVDRWRRYSCEIFIASFYIEVLSKKYIIYLQSNYLLEQQLLILSLSLLSLKCDTYLLLISRMNRFNSTFISGEREREKQQYKYNI